MTASLCKIPQLLLFPFCVFLSFLFAGIIICEILKFVNYLLDKEDLSIYQPCIAGIIGTIQNDGLIFYRYGHARMRCAAP